MSRTNSLTFLLILSFATHYLYGESVISNDFWQERLGDQLVVYTKTKALSYLYNIPYRYRPFKYSNLFRLHQMEPRCPNRKRFAKVIFIRNRKTLEQALKKYRDTNMDILYLVHYFTRINPFELPDDFREGLRPLMQLRKEPKMVYVPEGATTIAVHVRRGDIVGFKPARNIKYHTDEQYIDELAQLLERLNDPIIHVQIFTDHNNPAVLAKKFETNLRARNLPVRNIHALQEKDKPGREITIGSAPSKCDAITDAIIRDFFSMTSFDYLIRPYGSNFSIMAQFIGRHKEVVGVADDNPYTPRWVTKCVWTRK